LGIHLYEPCQWFLLDSGVTRNIPDLPGLIDSLTELWFYVRLDTKQVISYTFPRANLLAWYGKRLNLTQLNDSFVNQKKSTTKQNTHKKTKARFSRLLRHPAWKRSGSILTGKDKGGDKRFTRKTITNKCRILSCTFPCLSPNIGLQYSMLLPFAKTVCVSVRKNSIDGIDR